MDVETRASRGARDRANVATVQQYSSIINQCSTSIAWRTTAVRCYGESQDAPSNFGIHSVLLIYWSTLRQRYWRYRQSVVRTLTVFIQLILLWVPSEWIYIIWKLLWIDARYSYVRRKKTCYARPDKKRNVRRRVTLGPLSSSVAASITGDHS